MNPRRMCSAGAFALVMVLVSCGSGQGYDPKNVTVTVSPATGSVASHGEISLQATVNGLCSSCAPSINSWGIRENAGPGDSDGSSCDWFTQNGPPIPACPDGTIEETSGSLSNTLKVTYHAPGTPGTYHIVAEWFVPSGLLGSSGSTKNGTSAITVTP
jgi:hypothetical protein